MDIKENKNQETELEEVNAEEETVEETAENATETEKKQPEKEPVLSFEAKQVHACT